METVSILVPVHNEETTIVTVLKKLQTIKFNKLKKEIIVIDDGSTDTSWKKINSLKENIIRLKHRTNLGKGAAIKTGLKKASGKYIVIQDADLEYDPNEIKELIQPMIDNKADVVYGSRFVGSKPHRVLYFWHYLANKVATLLSNVLTNLNLTDVETGYKSFTKEVGDELNLEEKGFGFEVEFTAKIAKMKLRIFEVGISYSGRTYEEGKKITWYDGIMAIILIFRYNLF